MKRKICFPFFSIALILFCLAISGNNALGQSLTVRQIMAEPSLAGQRVEGEKLSPDGKSVIFLWNAEGKPRRDLYLVPSAGGTPQIILRSSDLPEPPRQPDRPDPLNYGVEVRDQFVRDRENQLGGFEWSPDSSKLIFSYGGDVYVMTLADRSVKRYTRTQAPEFGARFLDNERIIFSQGGNAFVLNTATAQLTQITREANQQQFISVGSVVTSKDGKMTAYVVSDSSKQRQLVVPNFLPEFVTGGGPRRGWTEQKLYFMPTDGSRNSPHEIKLPASEGVSSFRRMVWASDNRSLLVDRLDKDTKRRQLYYVHNVGGKDEKIVLITEETDDKWQAPLSAIFEPNPKNPAQLFFGSERDGYNHLYLATLQFPQPESASGETRPSGSVPSPNVDIRQITKGNWQVEWAKWAADGEQIVYMSTEEGYTERRFFALFPATGDKAVIPANDKGMANTPQMDDQNGQPTLLYGFSQWNRPEDLYAQTVCPKCRGLNFPVQLTRTTPESFNKIAWTVPRFIEIPSRDGKRIPAKIYLPAGQDPKKKYPMAIFVHGAGYLQNVINGWNNYYREFMFNDILAKKGYVVLDIDYRGSAGYGRDWRTDVYDFLGGKDFDDHIDAIDHMVKNYGVDQKRIGVYGGSYGGFMAGMLVMRAPERIAAAAALRSVFDWKNYYAANPFYTAQRLGFPDKNPEAYKRSSPITYADKLERPLLILHGMVDDNVHVQDSVQLVEKLIRLEKTKHFEMMFYPSENHGFVRPESWADEYERILWFFEKHLTGK
jgi:dipeptidyl aminopeptidase/acylaminoacyl peptidase